MIDRRVYFYRDGHELTGLSANGGVLVGFGRVVGHVRRAMVFEHVTVEHCGRTVRLSEQELGGPVTVKVWAPGGVQSEWAGIASVSSLAVNAKRRSAELATA